MGHTGHTDHIITHAAGRLGCDADSVVVNSSGWSSLVCSTVEAPIVIKYPRTENAAAGYHTDAAVLDALDGGSGGVTTPIVVEHNTFDEQPYLILSKLPGQQLDTVAEQLDTATLDDIGERIGTFLCQLHQLDVASIDGGRNGDYGKAGGDRDDGDNTAFVDVWRTRYVTARPHIYEALGAYDVGVLDELFHNTLGELSWAGEPGLCHSDLGGYNIMYNTNGVYIYDFADATYGNTTADFVAFGTQMSVAALTSYGAGDGMCAFAETLCRLFPVVDLASYINDQRTDTTGEVMGRIKNGSVNGEPWR